MIELLLQADRLLTVDLVDAADAIYRKVAEADPYDAIAVVGMARCALARGDDHEAYRLAARALAIDPQNDMARRMEARLDEVLRTRGEVPGQGAVAAAVASAPPPVVAVDPPTPPVKHRWPAVPSSRPASGPVADPSAIATAGVAATGEAGAAAVVPADEAGSAGSADEADHGATTPARSGASGSGASGSSSVPGTSAAPAASVGPAAAMTSVAPPASPPAAPTPSGAPGPATRRSFLDRLRGR